VKRSLTAGLVQVVVTRLAQRHDSRRSVVSSSQRRLKTALFLLTGRCRRTSIIVPSLRSFCRDLLAGVRPFSRPPHLIKRLSGQPGAEP
jgi:hypothetical protein